MACLTPLQLIILFVISCKSLAFVFRSLSIARTMRIFSNVGHSGRNDLVGPVQIGVLSVQDEKVGTSAILKGLHKSFKRYNIVDDSLFLTSVPRVSDLTFAANLLVRTNKFDSIICVGYLGTLPHRIASMTNVDLVSSSLLQLSLDSNVHCIAAVSCGPSVEHLASTNDDRMDFLVQFGECCATSAIAVGTARRSIQQSKSASKGANATVNPQFDIFDFAPIDENSKPRPDLTNTRIAF